MTAFRQHITRRILPKFLSRVQCSLEFLLVEVSSCNLTLDIWSSRRMHAYMGISIHFVTDGWKLLTYLLACSKMSGSHTADNIQSEYDSIVSKYNLTGKVFKVVMDNASNMCATFRDETSLPGFNGVVRWTSFWTWVQAQSQTVQRIPWPLKSFTNA